MRIGISGFGEDAAAYARAFGEGGHGVFALRDPQRDGAVDPPDGCEPVDGFDALLAAGGLYARLWERQSGGFIAAADDRALKIA